jgi:hypothetical protein
VRISGSIAVLIAAFTPTFTTTARASDAEQVKMLQQAHAWGRFAKGSWRQVQIVTETFDEEGRLTNSSTTDNKTTIDEVTPDRVTLKIEVTVEVAGQRIASQPQIVKQGYAGDNVGQTVSFKPLSPETLVIDGREMRCETEQIEIIGGVSKETSLISFAPRSIPKILRRKSTIMDPATAKTTQETVGEVYSLGRYFRVLDEIKPGYSARVVQKNDHGTMTTWSDHVPDIPGEVIVECSKKLDNEGRLVRRSTLELVAYGVDGEEAHRDPTPRRVRRMKRAR